MLPIGAGTEYQKFTCTNYTLLLGLFKEDCGTPPIHCTLKITGSSHTDVTIRGADDGSITAAITGASGTTVWYLNGVEYFSGVTSSHTFTGLTSGTYDVLIVDENDCLATLNDVLILDGEFRTGDFTVTSPTGLTAVENPIIIRVSTAVNNPNPLPNITTLSVDGNLSDGYSLQFNLTSPYSYTQTFYAKAYPNKPNYFLASTLNDQYGTPVGSNTHTEIATSLADALASDVLIPKIYYINNSGTVVTLQAKETGSRFNLTTGNTVTTATGITVTQTQVGTDYCDGQITDNYSISCEVMANTDVTTQYPETGDATDFNKIAELILPFQPSNTHKFDISAILKSQINTPMPDVNMTGSTLLPSVMQPYFCKLSELYPLVANTNTVKKRYKTNTDVQWVINSSLDRYAANTMQEYLGEDISSIHGDFGLTLSWTGGTGGTASVVFTDYVISGVTGTTGVEFSIWNYNNTTIVEAWQTGNTFTGVVAGDYYARISGMTSDGILVNYQKTFYVDPHGCGYDSTPIAHLKNNVKFLTNSPNPKQIQRSSNEFLYFLLPKNYGKTLKMRGDLYFYDGTSVTGQTFFTIATGTTNAGGCMILNLSYDKLGLQAYEVSGTTNRKIKRAELAVWQNDALNGDYQYTEEKVYRFEIDEMPRKFGVLFQNSLGMYDAFDFIGVVEETISRDYDNYTVPLDYNADGSMASGQRNTATYNTKILKKITCNSGWIDSEHFDWLMELSKSNNIYSTNTTTQNYLNLTDISYKKSSLDDLFDVECTFEMTIYENNITI